MGLFVSFMICHVLVLPLFSFVRAERPHLLR